MKLMVEIVGSLGSPSPSQVAAEDIARIGQARPISQPVSPTAGAAVKDLNTDIGQLANRMLLAGNSVQDTKAALSGLGYQQREINAAFAEQPRQISSPIAELGRKTNESLGDAGQAVQRYGGQMDSFVGAEQSRRLRLMADINRARIPMGVPVLGLNDALSMEYVQLEEMRRKTTSSLRGFSAEVRSLRRIEAQPAREEELHERALNRMDERSRTMGLRFAMLFGFSSGVSRAVSTATGGNIPLFGPISSLIGIGAASIPQRMLMAQGAMPVIGGALVGLEVLQKQLETMMQRRAVREGAGQMAFGRGAAVTGAVQGAAESIRAGGAEPQQVLAAMQTLLQTMPADARRFGTALAEAFDIARAKGGEAKDVIAAIQQQIAGLPVGEQAQAMARMLAIQSQGVSNRPNWSLGRAWGMITGDEDATASPDRQKKLQALPNELATARATEEAIANRAFTYGGRPQPHRAVVEIEADITNQQKLDAADQAAAIRRQRLGYDEQIRNFERGESLRKMSEGFTVAIDQTDAYVDASHRSREAVAAETHAFNMLNAEQLARKAGAGTGPLLAADRNQPIVEQMNERRRLLKREVSDLDDAATLKENQAARLGENQRQMAAELLQQARADAQAELDAMTGDEPGARQQELVLQQLNRPEYEETFLAGDKDYAGLKARREKLENQAKLLREQQQVAQASEPGKQQELDRLEKRLIDIRAEETGVRSRALDSQRFEFETAMTERHLQAELAADSQVRQAKLNSIRVTDIARQRGIALATQADLGGIDKLIGAAHAETSTRESRLKAAPAGLPGTVEGDARQQLEDNLAQSRQRETELTQRRQALVEQGRNAQDRADFAAGAPLADIFAGRRQERQTERQIARGRRREAAGTAETTNRFEDITARGGIWARHVVGQERADEIRGGGDFVNRIRRGAGVEAGAAERKPAEPDFTRWDSAGKKLLEAATGLADAFKKVNQVTINAAVVNVSVPAGGG